MTIVCDPEARNPTHHIKLTDGTNELGFILRTGNRVDPRAITRRPRQNGQYSPFTQSDWGSGRGIKDAQADRSRFADSKRAITRHVGSVMLGGQETYTTGYRQAESYMPGSLTWQDLISANRYIAYQVTASASGNREKIYIWVRRVGTPTSTLTVELCANDTDKPGTVLKTATATTANITDTVSQLYEFTFPSVQAVTATTVYWVKVYASVNSGSANCWQVGTDAADTNNLTKVSSDNSTWGVCTYDLYFRMVDATDQLGGLFFTYKNALYFVTRPSGSTAPSLYINGDRGIATGACTSTTVEDTTKSWTTNEWAGSVVYFVSGGGSQFSTPYRTITSNDGNTLTFSPASPQGPSGGDTVYVILGSNKWTLVTGHGLTVLPTSVCTSGDIVYFAQGDGTKMRKMREYVSNAVWTREFAEEDNRAKFLLEWRHPTHGSVIAKVNDVGHSGLPTYAQATPEAWSRRLKFPILLNACEATTNWTVGAGAAVALDNTDFMEGSNAIKVTVSSGPANPTFYFNFGSIRTGFTRTPNIKDLAGQRQIRFWFKSTNTCAAGDVKIFPSVATDAASTIQDINLPALPAAEWVHITLSVNDLLAGMSLVQSLGFRTTAATGTYWIDGIELIPQGSEVLLGNPGEKITGFTTYGDPETPWIFRTRSAGSVENGVFNPIPLKEMSQAENIHNGMGNVVSNVYLYFSFLHGLERFYRNNLDDVGPNRDEGLPDTRRGFITSMQAYPGRFFYNYDVLEGYSCIMESTSGTDHHEVYRCDTPGKRIRNLFIQVVPGDTADRLWFTEGDDIAWIPLPGNTLKEDTDDTFLHTHEAVLETGWIYGQEQDAVKLFHSVKLFLENATANRKIEWDYKTDDNTAWTASSSPFTTPPVQEISLSVSAKRVKFRFRLQTNNNTETPQIRALFVSSTTRPETRYTYTMRSLLQDQPINLRGEQDTSLTADAQLTRLDGWMEANTPLTMYSLFTPFSSKSVFLEPVVTNPLNIITDESKEALEVTLNLVEG
jgi:hypothetical protein